MADRLPQYPMLPNFNMNNAIHQQQQQQQQQQQMQHQQQDNHQNPLDQARAWQMHQMQQQFRAPAAADMNPANPQFAEMMKRSQSLNQQTHAARAQQQHLNQQQQFGMGSGMPQMNPGGAVLGGSAQQQSFHDSSSAHPQSTHIPPGFSNMGGMPSNQPPSLQARNPQTLGFPPQSAVVTRQLELIGMAQNQQPQNGPVNINKFNQQLQQHQLNQIREREQQQQQQQQFQSGGGMNHPSPADIFASPGMTNEALRRPSPHPANVPQPPTGQPSQPTPGVMMTPANPGGRVVLNFAEMTTRVTVMRNQVAQHEAMMQTLGQQLNAVRGTQQEAQISAKMKETSAELAKRKEYLSKLIMGINAIQKQAQQHQAQQQANGNGNGGGAGQGQPTWISHSNPPQTFDNGLATRNHPGQQPQQQLQPNSMQSSPSLSQSQAQANHLVNQGFVPPRGPTPQHPSQPGPQHTGGPFNPIQQPGQFPFSNSQSSGAGPSQPNQPGMSSQPGANGMNNFNGQNPAMTLPPLEKARFEPTFKSFCIKRNVKLDPRLLSIENRPVELYRLHVEVIKEGGVAKVDQKDMWNIIGGRLGFVQFPGTDTEPAKSGPGVAQQLAHIYKEYLAVFDQWYTAQAIESSRRAQMATANLQAQMNAARWTPQQMQQVIQMSHMSVTDLRAQGIDEKTISFVETHRASLQRTFQEQKAFQNKMRNASQPQTLGMPPQGVDQNGGQGPRAPGMGPSQSFGGQTQHNAAAVVARQQQFLHQHQQLHPQQQGQQPQQQPHQQLPPQLQSGQGMMQPSRIPPQQPQPQNIPTRMINADAIIQKIKQDYTTSTIPNLHPVDVPNEHRLEFNQILEALFRQCQDADQKLQMIVTIVKSEEIIRKLISIICTIQHQRSMLSTSNPRFLISLDNLKTMSGELQRIVDLFTSLFTTFRQQRQQQQQQQQMSMNQIPGQQQHPQHGVNNPMAPPNPMMNAEVMSQGRPPIPHQPPNAAGPSTQQQQLHRPPPSLHPPPIKRAPKAPQPPGPGAVSTPSPAPVHSASTPVANTPTPTAVASSPPAAKSPKTRAPPKPKAPPVKGRRASKAAPPAAPVPAPAPLEAVQPVASSSSVKRPREEESTMSSAGSSSSVANEPSPPKRAKTEWESPPSEELKKKNEAVENIKTEEEATAFFEQMTEFIKMAGGDGPSTLTTDISETLEMLLKGYGSVPDSTDGAGNVMMGEPSIKREPTPPAAMSDAFDEFIDFSFGTVEDEDNSKAPTPDLVSSSSTNPSPESNHESEVSHHIFSSASSSTVDTKTEESADPLRLGPWKDIDGGEGAYYQPNEWKWDSPMPSLDQPWAIFNP